MSISKIQTDRTKNGGKIFTLCGTTGCCPTVTVDKDERIYTIKDDFGGIVNFSKEQFKMLKEIDG